MDRRGGNEQLVNLVESENSKSKFYLKPELQEELSRIDRLSKSSPRNIMLIGPQGCGKTALFHEFIEMTGRPFIKMPCSVVLDPDEWYGTAEATEGTTTYHESEFTKMVETPRAAILLDDYGRSISPKVNNGLIGLLDDTARAQYIPGLKRTITVAPEVVFFATFNYGRGGTFVGQDPLDEALSDRFRVISMDYPDPDVERQIAEDAGLEGEEDSRKIVELFAALRGKGLSLSTRQLIQVAESRALGATWANAFVYTCLFSPGTGASDRVTEILQLLQMETGEGLTEDTNPSSAI